MTLNNAQAICNELDSKYGNVKETSWNTIYSSEEEIVDDLKKIYIPKKRVAPPFTFRGYEYIYSFAFYAQKGWTLSEKQMLQCKRLALEIKKAASIADYKF